MTDNQAIWKLEGSSEQFEIAILQAENALYRRENARLKIEMAELRAGLGKRKKS